MTTTAHTKADMPRPGATRLEALEAKIDRLTDHISFLAENQRRQQELIEEMVPIARQAMGVMGERLEEIEQKGYFAFGGGLVEVLDRIVTSYSTEDVQELGDNVVFILDAVRSVTQPDMVELAYAASNAVREAETDEARSLWGMFRESKDDDVRRGMAVMLEILRHVGKTARRSSHTKRLEAIAPTKCHPRARSAPAPAPPPKPSQPRPAAATAAPAQGPPPVQTTPGDGEAAVYIDGVGFDSEGFLLDNSQWTTELGAKVAAALGLAELGAEHWKVIDFARAEWEESGTAPNIRQITRHSGVSTKELYQLFPQAPAVMVAQIAGIPKPKGCI